MSEIKLDNGRLILNGRKFPESYINESRETHSNQSVTQNINGRKCDLTSYFKNQTLNQIHIHLDEISLSKEYKTAENRLKELEKKEPKLKEKILVFLIRKLKLNFLKRFLPKAVPEKNYIVEYIDFHKQETENVINFLLNTKKRNFNWGKVKIQVDPRGPYVFAEIRYYKNALQQWL